MSKLRQDITLGQAVNEILEYVKAAPSKVSHSRLAKVLHINLYVVEGLCRQMEDEGLLQGSTYLGYVYSADKKLN